MPSINGTGGIVNVGLTCYANSVFQAFRHCKNMESLFQEDKYTTILNKEHKYHDVTKQFANLVQTLSTISNNSSIRPNGFWHAFETASQNTCFDHLVSREPHDAHEFLMFLLDALHESLAKKVTMNITKMELKTERQKNQQLSLEVWKQQFEKHFSPFVDMYFGIFHIKIICDTCKNVSNKFETFNTLKGVFNDTSNPTILDCITNDLKEEIFDEYACEICKQKTKATKKISIWKLPTNLIIVLKRFTYDGKKINTPINCESTNIQLASIFSELSPNKKSSTFEIISSVDHHGSIHGGHYTAQGKHKENTWFLYDDTNVHSLVPSFGAHTYILFLEKQ